MGRASWQHNNTVNLKQCWDRVNQIKLFLPGFQTSFIIKRKTAYTITQVSFCAHLCMYIGKGHVWRSEGDTGYLPWFLLLFETRSLLNLKLTNWLNYLAITRQESCLHLPRAGISEPCHCAWRRSWGSLYRSADLDGKHFRKWVSP